MFIRSHIVALSTIVILASSSAAARADECPIRVASVVLEGKGISDHIFRYRVVLSAESDNAPSDIGLQIHIGTIHTSINARAPHLQLVRDNESFEDAVIFERPAQDVSGVAVVDTESGGVASPCSSPTVRVGDPVSGLGGWDISTVLVTLDDSKSVSPDTSRADLLPGRLTDAKFKTKAMLDYPEAAKDANVSGQVRALVQIGPSGQVENVNVVKSSGSKLLDDAALAAVSRSAFTGSAYDGIPVAQAYTIIYEFVLGDNVPLSPSDIFKLYCPAAVDDLSLATSLFSGSAFWYDVGLMTTGNRFDSVSLAVVGTHSPVKLLQWNTTLGGGSDPTRIGDDAIQGHSAVSGALFWPGDALAAATVQDATPHAKAAETCKPYGAHVEYDVDKDSIVAIAKTDRPWLLSPIVEPVLQARFAAISWPKYVPSASDPTTAVAVEVRVHVTQSGEPLVAIVHSTSLSPKFASAALGAAMASRYVVPLSPGGAPISQTFDVVYIYVPSK
jgi:TonB family protein